MSKLWVIVNALYYGHSLVNVETWKNVQNATNAVLMCLAIVPLFFPELRFSDTQVQAVANVVVAIGGGVVNTYFTTATTKKIGVSKKIIAGTNN